MGTRLGYFDVKYRARGAIKGKVLAEFLVEFTPSIGDMYRVFQVSIWPWKMYVDGASNAHKARIRIMLESLEVIVDTSPCDFLRRPPNVATLACICGGGVSYLVCVTRM